MTSAVKPDQKQNEHTYKHGHNSEENFAFKENYMKYFKTSDDHIKFTVIGNRVTKEFIYCMCLLTNLHKYRRKQFKVPVIRGVTSVEWPNVWNDLKIQFGSLAHCLKSEVAVLMDNKFLGDENELKEFIESRYVYHLRLDYYKEGIQQFANYINSQGRPCAYLHLSINGNPIGTLIFMLYADIVPLTCQNFLRMCKATKGGYAGTPIHRIVKDCWIQCGGFDLKSNKDLKCENFIIPHDRRGVLCMANNGRHNDCSTQFFVLLQPAHWMDHKYVAFGQLIDGEKTLRKIENVPTCYESPKAEIIIYKAGIFDINSTISINQHTKDYINGHIEDLNTIGEIFYEAIIENLFNEIDKKNVKSKTKEDYQLTSEDTVKNVRRAKSFMLKNEERDSPLLKVESTGSRCMSDSDETIDVNESDLQECEFEEYNYYKQFTPVATRRTDVKPKKQFYIPLADVRYPGEVHSNFDLQKLLRGDYCLQNDLQKDPVQKKEQFHIQDEVLCALFESYEKSDDEWEYFLGLDDEEEIEKYIKENVDTVSFAGRQVKKIANLNKKREIFDDLKEKTTKIGAITDEELRLIRMAKKYNNAADKKKKIHSNASLQSCMRDSETKSHLLRRISNLVHFDEEANDSDYDRTSDIFRDSANDSTKTHVRDEELYQLPSKMSFKSLYTNTSTASERQFLINTRKKQPSMTVVEYRNKNQFHKNYLKHEELININADNVKG